MCDSELTKRLKQYATLKGIDLLGIASAEPFQAFHDRTKMFNPKKILHDAQAVIVSGFYMKEKDVKPVESGKPVGRYNAYNVRAFVPMTNYHNGVLKDFIQSEGYSAIGDDRNQLPDKLLAIKAGLGQYGKNTLVITGKFGSQIMFTHLVTNAPLAYEEFPMQETSCGKCGICIKACPTGAIIEPFQLKKDLCITNWLWGSFIPFHLREKQENRLFGCGECVKVCPKNVNLAPRVNYPVELEPVSDYPELIPLLPGDEEFYKKSIASFPLFAGIDVIRGNAIIALGNTAGSPAISFLAQTLKHTKPQNRIYSAWALGKTGGQKAIDILNKTLLAERDQDVTREIRKSIEYAGKNI